MLFLSAPPPVGGKGLLALRKSLEEVSNGPATARAFDAAGLRRDTRVMTRVLLLCACLILWLAPPALARTDALGWRITDASMSERVTFQGDGGPGCARAGVCGYSGTITYGFEGIQDGDAILALAPRGRHRRAIGFGEVSVNSLTTVSVDPPGGGPPCTEKVLHHADVFLLSGTAGRIRVGFHDPRVIGGLLRSYCVGPSDADIWHADALPRLSVPGIQLRRRRLTLQASSTRSFHAPPFTGQVTFQATVHMRRIPPSAFLRELIIGF
jgi:hypothetical protein